MTGNNFRESTELRSFQVRDVLCRPTARMEGLAIGPMSAKILGRTPSNLVSLASMLSACK